MRFTPTVSSLVASTLTGLFVSFSLGAEPKPALPGKVWERYFGDDRFEYRASAMAATPSGDIWIAGASIPAGTTGEQGRFWVWKINQAGQKVREIEIPRLQTRQRLIPRHSYIRALAVLPSSDLLMIVEFQEDQPWLVRLGQDGKQIFAKALVPPKTPATVSQILPLGNERFLLIGEQRGDGLVIQVDGQGTPLWEKKYDRGKIDDLTDGTPMDDGTVLLVGDSGEAHEFGVGPSSLFLLKLDAQGNKLAEKSFRGRRARITKSQQGEYLIVYDESESMKQDIRVKALASDLSERWNLPVTTVDLGFEPYKIAAAPKGALIVGVRDMKLWISGIVDRRQDWTFLGEVDRPLYACEGFTLADDAALILFSVISVNDKHKLNTKVGLIKMSVD